MQARLKNLILATALAAVPLLAVPTPGSAQYGSNPPPAPAPGTVKPAPAPAPAPAPVPAPATVKPAPAPVPAASVVKDSTGGGLITFEAVLVDPTGKAQKKSAAVDVKVAGVSLIDADATDGKPKQGQAHIHYQLDKGPVIATTLKYPDDNDSPITPPHSKPPLLILGGAVFWSPAPQSVIDKALEKEKNTVSIKGVPWSR